MDKVFSILITVWTSLIVSLVYTQQIDLRHNGTTYNGAAYIKKDSVFFIECETQVEENLALTIRIPAAPTCALCYPNGFSFIRDECKDFVQFECLTNGTFRGELTVSVPSPGRYYCTYISGLNETYLMETIEPYNVTINGSAYPVRGENTCFTCSTSLAAPRPTFQWFTTDSDGTETEIKRDTDDIDDDRHYNTINIVIPSEQEIMDIWCVAKQTAFDVEITSEKLEAEILVRATPPQWANETGPIFYEPEEALYLVVSSNDDARPKANATWFLCLNGTDDQIVGDNQSSWNAYGKIWHAIVFRPSAYHDGVDVYCNVDQGPPLYTQNSSPRPLTRSDITTEASETITDSDINQGTTHLPATMQGLSTEEIVAIVLGIVFGLPLLLIITAIIVFYCCPAAFASCGLLSCCVKKATFQNTAETIPIE